MPAKTPPAPITPAPVTTAIPKEKIIEKLLSRILVNSQGMANLILWTKIIPSDKPSKIPAATDGLNVYVYDPFFALPTPVQIFYIVHSVMHIALRHPIRAQRIRKLNTADYRSDLCTAAQDAIINGSMEGLSWLSVPAHVIQFKNLLDDATLAANPPSKWCMESLYKVLKAKNKTVKVEEDIIIPADPTESTEGETEAESNDALWEKRMERAMSLSGSCKLLRRLGAEVKVSKTPWHLILKRHLLKALSVKIESCFSRPHRRTTAGVIDYYLPSTQRQRTIKEVAFVVDTSGSIGDQDLSRCLREVLSIQRITNSNIRIISADAAVQTDVSMTAAKATLPNTKDLFIKNIKGGGGTDFRPALELLSKKPPSICVYLTDTYGAFPATPPNFPVIWVSLNDQKAPWGITIEMDAL